MKAKYILVTGAYGGLGKAVVNRLIDNGYKVFAVDINIKESNLNQKMIPIKVDVTNDKDILNAFEFISKFTESLYAIINLAGIFYLDSIVEGDEEKLRRIIETNFFGAYKMNRAFLPLLKRGESRIINVTSELVSYSPQPFMGYYTISKGMLDIYCDVLRRELNYQGIKVIKIHSGSFKTKLLSTASEEYNRLINKTKTYQKQLSKLKFMMDKELEKNNNPDKFGIKILKIVNKKKPKLCYNINRSFSLRFLSILPEKLQDWIYLKFIK